MIRGKPWFNSSAACSAASAESAGCFFTSEQYRIHLVLCGMQNRTSGPYLAAINRILISLVTGSAGGAGVGARHWAPGAPDGGGRVWTRAPGRQGAGAGKAGLSPLSCGAYAATRGLFFGRQLGARRPRQTPSLKPLSRSGSRVLGVCLAHGRESARQGDWVRDGAVDCRPV
jgi:hypothetical protein